MSFVKLKTLSLLLAAGVLCPLAGAEKKSFYEFDLSKTKLEKNKEGNYLWKLSPGKEKDSITFDLLKLGVVPNDYDEIRVLMKNNRGFCILSPRVTNYPSKDEIRNWYSKRRMYANEWCDQRFDMRLDDDGWWFRNFKETSVFEGQELILTISKQYRRVPGEVPDREVEIKSVAFIRRSADLEFSELDAKLEKGFWNLTWTYDLKIRNREITRRKIRLELNMKDLKHFKPSWTKKVLDLGPRETVIIPLELSIPKSQIKKLPLLYSERVQPKLIFEDDSPEVFPWFGYRPRYIWATVPPELKKYTLDKPKNPKALLKQAEADLKKPFAPPPMVSAKYCSEFKPAKMEALSFFRIYEKGTGKDLSDDKKVTGAYIYYHNNQTFNAMKRMAQAYELTQNKDYAVKIRDILLEYAYWFKYMPPNAPSATSGGSRLTYTTLDLCYFLPQGVEAYAAVKDSGVFGADDCERIEVMFGELMFNLYSHCTEYSNQQLHHISSYGIPVIALNRYWNLMGDALYGDCGFYRFIDNGFTADGMALEGGVYHWFGFLPLLSFAEKIRKCGIELISPDFKKIYDHGINCTPQGVADACLRDTYVLGYQLFKDPKYLPTLKLIKKLPEGVKASEVPDTIFLGNTVQKSNGYLWLREESKYGFRAMAINFIMGWDRLEHDRLHYRLFDEEGMLSHEVFRVGYTNPGASMDDTISHNTIVIDEQNSDVNASILAVLLDRKSMPAGLITENPASRLYEFADFSKALAIFDGIMFVGDLQKTLDGKEHTFDWPFYAPWQPWTKPEDLQFRLPGDFKTPLKTSYKHVKSCMSSPVKDGLRAEVDIPPSTLLNGFEVRQKADRKLVMNFALPAETLAAKFQIGRGHDPKPGPMLMLRQKGKTASFGVAFEVVRNGAQNRVKSVKNLPFTPADPLSAVWEIQADSGTYYVIVNRTGKTLKSGNISTTKQYEVIKK